MNIENQIEWMQSLRDTYHKDSPCRAACEAVLKTLGAVRSKKPTLFWHYDTPKTKGVYPVKCDGPNPNAGYRHWDGTRWGAWSSTYRGAQLLASNPKIRKAQIKRPVMYATKSRVN